MFAFFARFKILHRFLANRRGLTFGGSELHSRSPRFRQSNGNRLLRRARSVFALARMVNLFPHKLTRLRRRRLTLRSDSVCSFNRFSFWHGLFLA
jgi:hypothetical protein